MKMMMKVMLMKIVVCVSDEVLNSQHYKHSQSTEASDQYANTRKIIYLKTVAHYLIQLGLLKWENLIFFTIFDLLIGSLL